MLDEKGKRLPIRDPQADTDADIYVYFEPDPDDFEYDESRLVQILKLPAGEGDSQNKACLKLRPKNMSTSPDKVNISISFFYQFNYVERIEVIAEVVGKTDDPAVSRLGKQAPISARYGKIGDWHNLDDVNKRDMHIKIKSSSGQDRYELRFLYAGLDFRGALRLTKDDLEDVIVRARDLMEYAAVDENSPIKKKMGQRYKKEILDELVERGRDLWVKLFEPDGSDALCHIGKFLRKYAVADQGTIQIVIESGASAFVFPWNLIYDGEYPPPAGASSDELLQGFWGMRYSIEQIFLNCMDNSYPSKPSHVTPLSISFMLFEKLPHAVEQTELMTRFRNLGKDKILVSQPVTEPKDFLDLLKNCASHILYFYSKGFTRRREADIGYKRASTPDLETGAPNPERSFICLSTGEIYLEDLNRSKSNYSLKNNPIVILNMCESAQITPTLSEGFIPFFLGRKATAVIGTECPMTADFAHPFADNLLISLLAGDNIGIALLKARRSFLKSGEFMAPLGLAYTLYGSASVGFQPPLLLNV